MNMEIHMIFAEADADMLRDSVINQSVISVIDQYRVSIDRVITGSLVLT